MRIGTISFASLDNYGAILQAYALGKLLETPGNDVSVIDYRFPGLRARDSLTAMHLSYARHAAWPVILGVPKLLVRSSRMECFRQEHLARTRPLYSSGELSDAARSLEAVISGSDEIFRLDRNGAVLRPFFLDFADPARQTLVAYAACSAGISDYGARNEEARKLLGRFHKISVRDEATRTLVKNLTGNDPQIVLDPTLLWSFDELSLPEIPAKNYLLVYGYFRKPETDRLVRETADRLGMQMISINWASKYAHQNILAADPLEWLSYLKHARLVFTNCFHGIMFSALYQRDFLVFESEMARSKLTDFTNRFSLSSRLLPTGQRPTSEQLAGMDHENLARQLQPLRNDSMAFLDNASGTAAALKEVRTRIQETPGRRDLPRAILQTFQGARCSSPWRMTLAGWLLLAGVATLHIVSDPHLVFTPFYLLPCAWLALMSGRRQATILALAAAAVPISIQSYKDVDFTSPMVLSWNLVMRFIIFQVVILLLDQICRRNTSSPLGKWFASLQIWSARLTSRSGAVFAGFLLLTLVSAAHAVASPYLVFIPLYLIPCIWLTLAVGPRWATLAALLSAIIGPVLQSLKHAAYQSPGVLLWNGVMPLVVLLTVSLLLDHLRQEVAAARSRRGAC